ncbi:MAG: NAD-dependent epimerase/dehydratase family protein [Candidatus Nitrohelix vancouverensis]|uniref:NAD-dependent epimerase/dehydratase family protein n=1 Tax=Candidatus Nitrohelix vancouverensis TaxID=2705534 RepID=A0A7T0G425_9BACT|nr:MAG: NAD-dependent epimerase/dehydratase family protein [Candidatus Nitrohelix vancouverensis]
MKVLVTGGGGFLGSHIAMRLLAEGQTVSILGRKHYAHLPSAIIQHCADLRDLDAVSKAVAGCDAVYHVAAIPGVWGSYDEYHSINVGGTQNVIHACKKNSAQRLIYTSSPSVVFHMTDQENVDESTPYPERYYCDYSKTKAQGESLVAQANDPQGLKTVSLRPHLIWGPGDAHLIPRIIHKAKTGRLVKVGEGKNKVDMTYIDNAVEAHLKAEQALRDNSEQVGGQAYFISDGQPVNLWDWVDRLLSELELPPIKKQISHRTAHNLGAVFEMIYGALRINREPPLTRFVASQLATSHHFNISRARNELGYAPSTTPEEGMQSLLASLRTDPSH